MLSPAQKQAREDARTDDGTFGAQEHTAPELTLQPYTFPALKHGIRPNQVFVSVWVAHDEQGTPRRYIGAYPTLEDGPDNPLLDPFPLPGAVADERDDDWFTLENAPAWARDAVLPSLADHTCLHPDAAFQSHAWRRQRHDTLLAEGAFATAYNNTFLADFEAEHPAGQPEDAVAGMYELAAVDEDTDEDARETAAAELSRRAAAGVGGVLVDTRRLRAGDLISISHLGDDITDVDRYRAELAVVHSVETWSGDGEVILTLSGGDRLALPLGARLPTAGFEYDGTACSPLQTVQRLVLAGELPATALREDPAAAIAIHNVRVGPLDAAYVHPLTPRTGKSSA